MKMSRFGWIAYLCLPIVVACSSSGDDTSSEEEQEEVCTEGETRDCSCSGGGSGEQACSADGRAFDACVCKPTFPAVSDFAAPGSFPTTRNVEGPACEVFRPSNLGEGGLLHPVIVWGNGTFVTPDVYALVLDHWATHGFFVIAASTTNAGTGIEMITCLDYALGEYAGQVDPEKIGTSGHSQGGGGSIMAGRDPRVKATVPLQPFTVGLGHDPSSQSQQHGPMLLLSGTEDTWAAPDLNQQPVFDASNVPTFWATRIGADHLASGTNDITDYRRPATAWFRLHLMGDESGRGLFYGPDCELCTDSGWIVQQKDL
jgi:hypothetical protein